MLANLKWPFYYMHNQCQHTQLSIHILFQQQTSQNKGIEPAMSEAMVFKTWQQLLSGSVPHMCHRACMRCLKTSAPWTTQEHFTFCCNICTWGITASDPRCEFVSEVFIQPYVPKGTPVVEGKHWHDRLRVEFTTWCVRYRVVYVTKICPSYNYIEVIAWTTL
jgi:hypothetical protein